ncbi:putative leucine-rich repeat domain, L domain-containing protein [Medicago truncatula]|nr:putative leucine-rich repeat domain, L domain-containing protein [Medicago truncatula]
MHDLVHDLAQSIMGEECVASEVLSLTDLSIRTHHISCFDTKGKFDYNMTSFEKVESLRTFLEFKPPCKILDLFPSITPLRALRTSSFQLSGLKNIIHLRYLELYESKITTLPESVCRLQKLQTLKLERCDSLSSFPKKFTQLEDLRHLIIKDCQSLVSSPFRIRELTCLKTLTIFIVGSEIGFGLAELQNLQLGGKLHIRGLQNVSNEGDAKEANLIGKKDLNHLYLSWGDYPSSQVTSVDAERVLEALEPHSGLKRFGMKDYGGIHFPPWMRNTSFLKSLVCIILYDCKNCKQLSPLGKLPCLTTLFLSGMRNLKYIEDDLYEPASEKAFASLKKLTLRNLPNLERVLEVEGVEMLPQLSFLSIECVPKLALSSLPSVEFLFVTGGNEELLKSIFNNNCNEDATLSPQGTAGNNIYNLKLLYISDFAKLKELPDELGTLSTLEVLHIQCCDEIESFSEHLLQGLSSLRTLCIHSCHEFKSLSEVTRHLTCLEGLEIIDCPQCVFPNNMNSLTSLHRLKVSGQNANILDGIEGNLSVKNLSLTNFPSLTSLPDWLGAMTTLQRLKISGFPKLRSLPDSFQQLRNLQRLSIVSCSMLEKRCKRGIGEDWDKIAHIPEVELESKFDAKPTFCENIISTWKVGKHTSSEFDQMIDIL